MKKTMSMMLLSTLLLGSMNTAVLAEKLEDGSYKSVVETKGDVNFVVDNSETTEPPVGPLDPEYPEITPVEPDAGTGQTGPLTIDFVSTLNFGTHKISTKKESYKALASKATVNETGETVVNPNYVQITDKTGSLNGWTLTVAQTQAFTDSEGATLEGAVINITNGNVLSPSNTAGVTAKETIIIEMKGEDPIVNDVMKAEQGHGAGQFFYMAGNKEDLVEEEILNAEGEIALDDDGNEIKDWFNSAVQLEVPGASEKKATSYQAALTWTLTNTPGA